MRSRLVYIRIYNDFVSISFIYKEAYDFPNADIQVSVHSSETEFVCLHTKMVNPYYISFSFYSFLLRIKCLASSALNFQLQH